MVNNVIKCFFLSSTKVSCNLRLCPEDTGSGKNGEIIRIFFFNI